jgi:hypothetical protein
MEVPAVMADGADGRGAAEFILTEAPIRILKMLRSGIAR